MPAVDSAARQSGARPAGTARRTADAPRTTREGIVRRGRTGELLLRAAGRVLPGCSAVLLVAGVWQLIHLLGLSPVLPAPSAVLRDLSDAWSAGTLGSGLLHSLGRCLAGFAASAAVGAPLGLLLHRFGFLRVPIAPVLSAFQSLPAAVLVPIAVICLGTSRGAVYMVVLLGAVPSVATGVLSALDQVPPLLVRAGRSMGATGAAGVRHVLLPAALPGVVAALRQGWAFGWRALMTAELMTASPLPGLGQMLDAGRRSGRLSLVLAAAVAVLAVGVLVEVGVFGPVQRRVLRARGLPSAGGC
ncbi:ABC transporter permease [Streptomyces candidus]|uniref:NitT/TauT family transport system permease protein n=1 Tax=Streptomyces candidus TaxID=67283 RepID=A0A7X0HLA7_9ACTN|nr:ABC transporter permease subunit [Streptomyces candidus]MBB6439761.1 NitT/TauT family transport system permease protein [Streptomyces candidus]GHH57016.1 sulfate ABC transporter permease [Streptomyces candidus]